jgi:hypothetical protein
LACRRGNSLNFRTIFSGLFILLTWVFWGCSLFFSFLFFFFFRISLISPSLSHPSTYLNDPLVILPNQTRSLYLPSGHPTAPTSPSCIMRHIHLGFIFCIMRYQFAGLVLVKHLRFIVIRLYGNPLSQHFLLPLFLYRELQISWCRSPYIERYCLVCCSTKFLVLLDIFCQQSYACLQPGFDTGALYPIDWSHPVLGTPCCPA